MNRENILESELIGVLEDLDEMHMEISRLRAQVGELVAAGQEALNVIWVENLVANEEGNIRYEATTKAVYDKLRAAIAAAEGGAND